jgi:enterochelin esterase-like enzyme/sugar lactone lactonase YvrE
MASAENARSALEGGGLTPLSGSEFARGIINPGEPKSHAVSKGARHKAAANCSTPKCFAREASPKEKARSEGNPMALKASVTRRCTLILCALFALMATARAAQEEYPLGPDSQHQPGVRQGTVTRYTWTSPATTGAYPGTVRDYWVYVPAQYTPDKPACVMVFQDGATFIKEDGRARIPIVFDNLVAKHEMPVTIGIFINPGVLQALSPDQQDRFNRSFENDGLGDRYARFLLDEVIPEVAKHYNISKNPDDRAISGLSSGGICAFTVAWNRPDAFHRVLSFIGSFADLRGGDIYSALIRKTEPKPLRVFLQDGSHDLNMWAGDWWLANQSMASALEYAGYDVKFVTGDKDHDMDQGGAVMPDALRWLWRDYPQPIAKPAPNRSEDKRTAILDRGHDWEAVAIPPISAGLIVKFADDGFNWIRGTWESLRSDITGLTADAAGDVFYSDLHGQRIVRIETDGKVSTFMSYAGHVPASHALMFGPDKSLYSCEGDHIVAYGLGGKGRAVASGINCEDLAVGEHGSLYFTDPFTDPKHHAIWYVDRAGHKKKEGLPFGMIPHPKGIRFSADESLLLVDDPDQRWVWSFQIQPDGSLAGAEPFYRLETPDDSSASRANAMTVDSLGYLYVATRLGIQVCDQPGRVVAIINPPEPGPLTAVSFGGADLQDLYVVANDKLFKRHLLRKGTLPWAPLKPPVPQL